MLSDRLFHIAQMIEPNEAVFDVGSDHALLPCFLMSNDICPKVYAGEIAEGPLKRAKENIRRYGLEGKVIPVLGDGLQNAPDDVQIVVIAGMGYHTIRHILEECDVSSYDYFILQCNSEVDKLRQYLSDHHYTIEDEKVVFDGFYYQIIRFSSAYHESYTPLQIKYGPLNLLKQEDVFRDYLQDLKEKLLKINVSANKEEYRQSISEIEALLLYNFER